MSRQQREDQEMKYASARDRAEKHEQVFESTTMNLPPGKQTFRFTRAKTYRLDFFPYKVVKGDETPGGNPNCGTGFWTYERTFWIHAVPTPDGIRSYCCLKKTFRKKCPICENVAKEQAKGTMDEDMAKLLNPKERQLFNVKDLDEPEKGVRLFEHNYWELGRHIDAKIKTKEKYEGFFRLKGGKTIEIAVSEDKFKGKIRYKPEAATIDFEERAEDYDSSILDDVLDLDGVLKEYPYEQLKKIYLQEPVDDDLSEKEEKKSERAEKAAEKKKDDESDRPYKPSQWNEGDYVFYKKMECEVKKVHKDGTLDLEDEDGDMSENVDPSKVSKVAVKTSTKEEEPKSSSSKDDDDLDIDEDDEPKKSRR